MDINYEEKQVLFKVRKTVIEMLNDRNYNYHDNISFNEFSLLLDANNININIDDKMYVHFYNDNKNFGKNEFKNIVNTIQKDINPDVSILIIIREPENSAVKNELMKAQYKNVELFLQKRLTFNITKHESVPKHILLTDEEIEEIEKKYNCSKTMFPKMYRDDPVAKYYGAKNGDMFKIIRKSYSVGQTIAYRIVK